MPTHCTPSVESTTLAAGFRKILARQTHSKGASEHLGNACAHTISKAMVMLSTLAVSACNQPTASLSMKEIGASHAAVALESFKARESAYVQHKELGSIFAKTQYPR